MKTVRMKLNTIRSEFRGKNVLLVDDSIVRGTTSRELVAMAREAGARKVYVTSAAPPVRWPNVYGIDIPTKTELIAYERDEAGVAGELGADWVVYQELDALKESIRRVNPSIPEFEASCFDGAYATGNITEGYLEALQGGRGKAQDHQTQERAAILARQASDNALHKAAAGAGAGAGEREEGKGAFTTGGKEAKAGVSLTPGAANGAAEAGVSLTPGAANGAAEAVAEKKAGEGKLGCETLFNLSSEK